MKILNRYNGMWQKLSAITMHTLMLAFYFSRTYALHDLAFKKLAQSLSRGPYFKKAGLRRGLLSTSEARRPPRPPRVCRRRTASAKNAPRGLRVALLTGYEVNKL
jgi:hypothetical protein